MVLILEPILSILPSDAAEGLTGFSEGCIEELRFRVGQSPSVVSSGVETVIPNTQPITAEALRGVLSAAAGGALYRFDGAIRAGFLTLPGGHRIGICGTAVMDGGEIKTILPSSLAIRVARECRSVGIPLTESTLIVGPPGSGKTTLLRDCVRLTSDRFGARIVLIDERGEIAAMQNETPQLYVGRTTDVMSGCSKRLAIPLVIRTMNPQWIAVDEITEEADVLALCRGAYCGVKFIATCHVLSLLDLSKRAVYRLLLRANLFSSVLLLQQDHTWRRASPEECL